jgi:hypothetical protein
LPLTNTVKELEENLDFGIQKLIKSEPGLILVNNDNEKHLNGVVGDADALGLAVFGVRCNNEMKRICSLTRTRKTKKRKPF